MKHNIYVENKNKNKECSEDKNLMDGLSVCTDLVPKGCHNGACGICRIHIVSGEYTKSKMNRKHISEEDENNNIALSCRVFPKSDMKINFLTKTKPEMNKKVYVLGN